MSKVVQLSEAASIAIHSMVLIAKAESQINVNKIAEATGSSKNHLAKVMQRLVKENLVKSNRGPTGGFQLNKSADKITLLDIYHAIEGSITDTECPLNRSTCPFNKCLMGGVVHKMNHEIRDYLKSQTLKSLALK